MSINMNGYLQYRMILQQSMEILTCNLFSISLKGLNSWSSGSTPSSLRMSELLTLCLFYFFIYFLLEFSNMQQTAHNQKENGKNK